MQNLKILWFFLRPHALSYAVVLFIGIILAILDLINISLLYPILAISTNQVSHPNDGAIHLLSILQANFSEFLNIQDPLVAACLLFIIFALFSFVFGALNSIITLRIIRRITTGNNKRIFEKQINADYQFFLDNKQGDLIYKTLRAPSYISEVFLNVTKLSVDMILSISIFLLLITLTLPGTMLVFCVGVGYYGLTRYLSRRVSYVTGSGRYKASQQANVTLNEYITGVKQIKVFEVSHHWYLQFSDSIDQFYKLWEKDGFWIQIPSLFLNTSLFVSIAIIIVGVKVFTHENFITILPILGTFSLAILKLMPKLGNLGNVQMSIMGALPNLQIVKEVLEDCEYSKIVNGIVPFTKIKSNIYFDNVMFGYKNREKIFNGLYLPLNGGRTTAIVGSSGSGKSTIIDLLLRLYDVDDGVVLIDGIDIKHYDLTSFRSRVGYVSQETFIFHASIRDNITFGEVYSDEEILKAATYANGHEFIMQLPQQYDTLVGDRGIRLSGGERQRIAIARAIIREPELLILDEATSSLDNVSERLVQDAINTVAKKCTTVIVAHRLSTVRNADVIYLLDMGKVVESGTHYELIDRKGKYWEMYMAQEDNGI